MPCPSPGWGACENLIFQYYLGLQKLGIQVDIINIPNRNNIIEIVNNGDYTITHVHYDCFYDIIPHLKSKLVCISSHFPYIDQIHRHPYDNYGPIFKFMIENSHKYPIFAISEKDQQTFINWGSDPRTTILMPNGVNEEEFVFVPEPKWPDKTVCLARVESRKRQHLTEHDESVMYIGKGPMNHMNYMGEILATDKFNILTNFANGIMLSDGENGINLACKEYAVAGLGMVVSYPASTELQEKLPWVVQVTEHDLIDREKISQIIKNNRSISLQYRKEIRSYAIENWSWSKLIPKYVENLQRLLEERKK